MSVRSRAAVLDAPAVQVSKVFGPNVPAATVAAEARSQMTPASPFSPGTPIGPYDGFSRTPRTQDYVTGYNIATRPRTHERVSFDALKGLIGAYDVAQIAIWHRIDSLRGIKWKLLAADHYNGDVSGAVPLGVAALRKPDRINGFRTWFAKWMWDVFAYDAGALYRLRNRGGKCIGLLPVDGTMIAPLLDYWGNPPGAMAMPGEDLPPAYVQYVNGLPWNWLTRADLVYEPFRPHNDSPYGHAPIESIMLNSNTDIRFQLHFLQRYTDGNIPAAFASAPDTWTPDQIEAWQALWDSFMYGDQARKNQIRWMPGGSKIMWSNEKDFTDAFSLFMMRKSCAAFHVVPTDLGFTETSNYSSGESQGDVQHRVGELPSMEYAEEILSRFVYDDLQLPLKFEFDRGEDQDDRVAQAQADEIYWKIGAAGPSEIREWRYGRSDPVPIPRSIFTERAGPIPIASLLAVAGQVDPETALPAAGAPLPEEVFGGTEGVLPNPPIKVMSLAEREFGPKAMPPAPPPQPVLQPGQVGQSAPAPVAKEGEGAPAAGITSDTGLYSYDLAGRDDEDDDGYPLAAALTEAHPESVTKELAAFRRFARGRRKAGQWRDFTFEHLPAGEARRLNDDGRAAVAKAGAPGLTARSGMISLDLPEGLIEPVPGGVTDHHVTVVYLGPDVDDEALAAACDRARQAAALADGPLSGTVSGVGCFPPSAGSDGKVPAWAAVAVPGAEVLRNALADLSASEHRDWQPHVTLAYLEPGDPLPAPLEPVPVTFTHLSVHRGDEVARFPLGPGVTVAKSPGPSGGFDDPHFRQYMQRAVQETVARYADLSPGGELALAGAVAKAGDGRPKVPSALSAPEDWPGWQRDLTLSGIYAGRIRDALRDAVDTRALAREWLAQHPGGMVAKAKREGLPQAVTAFLAAYAAAVAAALAKALPGAWAEGWVLGQQSAQASAAAAAATTPREVTAALEAVDWAGWQPGDVEAAYQVAGTGLRDLLADQEVQIKSIASSRLEELGNILADHLSSPETEGPVTYSVDSLANSLEDVLDNPSRAEMVAQTEIARAQSAAARWVFGQIGVQQTRISTAGDSRVCPTCLAAETAGAQPLGTYTVPLHPRCRCAEVAASPPLTSLASVAGALGLDGS